MSDRWMHADVPAAAAEPDAGPLCEFTDQAMCEAPQTAWVSSQAPGDSLRARTPHALQLTAADPDARLAWPEPEPEAEP